MNFFDYINPYAYAMTLRRFLYGKGVLKSVKVVVPVISIGNLSMGGTGKTPVTLALARYCIENLKKKTAIVLRGYKRSSTGLLIVADGKEILHKVTESGDEAQLYAYELKGAIVVCDEDRVRGAQAAVTLGAEVILLDDGFQHLRLRRDINILLISSSEGIPAVLPFGKGRESYAASDDADLILITNSDETSTESKDPGTIQSQVTFSYAEVYSPAGKSTHDVHIFAGARILVLSGIAHPEHFEKTIAALSGMIIPYRLPDHADYDFLTLQRIASVAKQAECSYIATTTKDATKIVPIYKELLDDSGNSFPELAVIHTEIKFLGNKEILFQKINDLFK